MLVIHPSKNCKFTPLKSFPLLSPRMTHQSQTGLVIHRPGHFSTQIWETRQLVLSWTSCLSMLLSVFRKQAKA